MVLSQLYGLYGIELGDDLQLI